jgi:arginase
MALALALGRGPRDVVAPLGASPVLLPEHVALVGFRALDPGERDAIGDLGLALPAPAAARVGMRVTAALALDAVANEDGPILIHLDVDAINYAEMPVKDAVGGAGLSIADVSDLLTALVGSPRVVGLHIAEFNPARDPEGIHARQVIELLARAVARRVGAR